jgi:hypothetical protein
MTTLSKIILDNVFRSLIAARASVLNSKALITFALGKEGRMG